MNSTSPYALTCEYPPGNTYLLGGWEHERTLFDTFVWIWFCIFCDVASYWYQNFISMHTNSLVIALWIAAFVAWLERCLHIIHSLAVASAWQISVLLKGGPRYAFTLQLPCLRGTGGVEGDIPPETLKNC